MEKQRQSENEKPDMLSRIFDDRKRRMNRVRGEVFIFWGLLVALTSLAEYGLYRWTGDMRILWSWLVPIACGYVWTIYDSHRKALERTAFDELLTVIWTTPAILSAASILFAVAVPMNTIDPVGITQLLLATAVLITAEFFRGKASQHTGSFAALLATGITGATAAFNFTFREPFDAAAGEWMLALAFYAVMLLVLPGFILRHIRRKQCSKS